MSHVTIREALEAVQGWWNLYDWESGSGLGACWIHTVRHGVRIHIGYNPTNLYSPIAFLIGEDSISDYGMGPNDVTDVLKFIHMVTKYGEDKRNAKKNLRIRKALGINGKD